MHLDPTALGRPAGEGTRAVVLALLDAADSAATRMEREPGPERLHDFRVALRRLRTTLRAFRPWVQDDVPRRLERKLRRCARATNRAREAAVQLELLRGMEEVLRGRQRGGVELLVERLQEVGDPAAARAVRRYRAVAAKLSRRLHAHPRRGGTAPGADGSTFASILAAMLEEQLATARKKVDGVRGSLDAEGIHVARIAAKRLRYLLEPLRRTSVADPSAAVERLKDLQDVLGGLHDLHQLARRVRSAMAEAGERRARRLHDAVWLGDPRRGPLRDAARAEAYGGLFAIVRLLRTRREALFGDFERRWRPEAADLLAREVHAITAALEVHSGGEVSARGEDQCTSASRAS